MKINPTENFRLSLHIVYYTFVYDHYCNDQCLQYFTKAVEERVECLFEFILTTINLFQKAQPTRLHPTEAQFIQRQLQRMFQFLELKFNCTKSRRSSLASLRAFQDSDSTDRHFRLVGDPIHAVRPRLALLVI